METRVILNELRFLKFLTSGCFAPCGVEGGRFCGFRDLNSLPVNGALPSGHFCHSWRSGPRCLDVDSRDEPQIRQVTPGHLCALLVKS